MAFHLPKHTSLFLPKEGPLKQQADQRPLPDSKPKLTNGKKAGIESNYCSAKQQANFSNIYDGCQTEVLPVEYSSFSGEQLEKAGEDLPKQVWNKNCDCRAITVVELPLEVRLLMFLMD